MQYEPVIGLEVHAQLLTQSKIFCRCSAQFGGEHNSQVCPICLGMPGVLPVLNKRAVEFAIRIALATDCRIADHSIFARKNYFYPDLPKGYQISQFEEPLCQDGHVDIEIDGERKRIGITRIHLEEDAGKSIHDEVFVDDDETLVDVNRCGVPLIEIVGEPDIRSAKEAGIYLTTLRQLVRYLEICDGNMEEGSLRCDANVSVRRVGETGLGVKTELKNMNSIRGVERALGVEIGRQIGILENGGEVVQKTLLWDADTSSVRPMRSKEFSHDYRYFPEPDLVPLEPSKEWINEIKSQLPELPEIKKNRFVEALGLPEYDAEVLTEDKDVANYFEKVFRTSGDPKMASNWVMGEVMRALKERQVSIKNLQVQPEEIGKLIQLIKNNTISGKIGKSVFEAMIETGKSAGEIIGEKGLQQISDSGELEKHVSAVLDENPKEVEKYRSGKQQVIGFLVGQVMRKTGGKANPKLVNEILRKKLTEIDSN